MVAVKVLHKGVVGVVEGVVEDVVKGVLEGMVEDVVVRAQHLFSNDQLVFRLSRMWW